MIAKQDVETPGAQCVNCRLTKAPSAFYQAEGFTHGRMDECKVCYDHRTCHRLETEAVSWRNAKSLLAWSKRAPCADCKEHFAESEMSFDHVPERGTKLFSLRLIPRACDEVMVEREIAKCDLVCAGCYQLRNVARTDAKPSKRKAATRVSPAVGPGALDATPVVVYRRRQQARETDAISLMRTIHT